MATVTVATVLSSSWWSRSLRHPEGSPPPSLPLHPPEERRRRGRWGIHIQASRHTSDHPSDPVGSVGKPYSVPDAAAEGRSAPPQVIGTVGKVRKSRFFRRRPLWSWRRILFASKKVRSIILLNVLTVIYASNIPVVKEIEAIMDPALFNLVRFTVSAIPFLPFVLQSREDVQTRLHGIELGCWVSFGYLAQALGLLASDAGRASFLSAFTVIVVPLVDGFFGTTIPSLTWGGAIVSLIGVGMLESSGSPPSVGDLLNLLSAVFFGIHILRTEHISRITKKEKVFALLGYEVWVVALFSAIWCFISGVFGDLNQVNTVSWKWTTAWDWIVCFPWIPALYTGVFSSGLCLWAEISAMYDVSATETAIIYGLEPLWGASFAWFLLGERWDATGWLGAALVLGGSLTVQIFGSAPEKVNNDQDTNGKLYRLNKDKPNDLTLSTVVVSSQKNMRNVVQQYIIPTPASGIYITHAFENFRRAFEKRDYLFIIGLLAEDDTVASISRDYLKAAKLAGEALSI